MNLQGLTERCVDELCRHVSESISLAGRSENGGVGPKRPCCVVIDPALASLFAFASPSMLSSSLSTSMFVRAGAMREQTINDGKLDWSEDGPLVFFLRPHPETARKMARQIRFLATQRSTRIQARAVFVPRRSFRCELVLKEESALPFFSLGYHSVSLGFVNVEPDLLSMELPHLLKEARVEDDTSAYSFVARALLNLGEISPRKIKAKGFGAKEVLELYVRMRDELEESRRATQAAANSSGEGDELESVGSAASALKHEINWLLEEDLGEDESPEFQQLTASGGPLDALGHSGQGPYVKQSVKVDTVLILDRELDMVSPLLTPLTYESLMDETFGDGIKPGFLLDVKSSVLRLDDLGDDSSSASSSSQVVTLKLKDDIVFNSIRNESVLSVMQTLNQQARELKEEQERIHRMTDPEELQRMVQNVPKLQQKKRELSTHIALCQKLTAATLERRTKAAIDAERRLVFDLDATLLLDRVVDSAARGDSLFKVLRMLCLSCVVSGGFDQSTLNEYRRDILHAYGFQHILTLEHLERIGLLTEPPFHPQHKFRRNEQQRTGKSSSSCVYRNWNAIKTAFNLVVEEARQRDDISYVFSGIAPLSVRLVELEALEGGWDRHIDKLAMLGEHPTFIPAWTPNSNATSTANVARPSSTSMADKKVLVVVYLGGVSRAEIAALRFLSESSRCPYRIVIGTTSILNGSELIKSCCHGASLAPPVARPAMRQQQPAAAESASAGGFFSNPFA